MAAQRVYTPEYAPVKELKLNPKQTNKPLLNKKAKKRTVIAVFLLGIMLVVAVVVTAVAESLSYSNSILQNENEKIASEINDIEIEMQSAVNIGTVEKKATKSLGMVYPVGSQYVKVNTEKNVDNFASALKKEAFN